MNKEQQEELRKPFKSEQIQTLSAGYANLDYVSHAWVTDRLLQIDPEWTWEPVGFDEYGLPKLDEHNGLWIKLTVCGVTRYGYGEPQGKDVHDQIKGAIGNAIRVAAMRFGVALDLWTRESPAGSEVTKALKMITEAEDINALEFVRKQLRNSKTPLNPQQIETVKMALLTKTAELGEKL